MKRRELLQLAKTYRPDKDDVVGWYLSEKLDGTRAFWDGGASRGKPTCEVPWASIINPRTGLRKDKIKPVATGLWSRYGNPIVAPDWFLDQLPPFMLDGELWAGHGNFQLCRSIVAGDEADARWDQIRYCVYGDPGASFTRDGEIRNANMRRVIDQAACWKYLSGLEVINAGACHTFERELEFLESELVETDHVYLLDQHRVENLSFIDGYLGGVLEDGGEGVMLRNPDSVWTPKRVSGLLKFKPFQDAEAEICGFVTGRQGKQGNVLGKIGAIVCRMGDVRFEIGTGLTMDQREFPPEVERWASENPETPTELDGKHFKVGDLITFRFRELSDDGIPKEARLWRVYQVA